MSKNKKPTVKQLMGRPQKYKDPEDLLKACYDYFEYCDQNPWYKNDALRSGDNAGQIVEIPTQRPYTKQGLYDWLQISRNTWDNLKERDDNFLTVITHVENKITTNQLEGAQVGAYNSNIVARLLGLHESQNINLGNQDGEGLEISVNIIDPRQNGKAQD